MQEVLGNIKGLRTNLLREIRQLYEINTESSFISEILLTKMAELTEKSGREIVVYINRRGRVESVALGDEKTVELPDFEGRKASNRLSGITCIHTHPNANSMLSDLDITSLKKNRYDMMVAVGVNNATVTDISVGVISDIDENANYATELLGTYSLQDFLLLDSKGIIAYIENILAHKKDGNLTHTQEERAYLVGIDFGTPGLPIEESLEELAQLTKTAGAKVVGRMFQKRSKVDSSLYIGSGRVEELSIACQEHFATMAVFDDELSPAQQRNLERALGVKIVDRTALILDIFAQRANTHEGKLQVELAQLKYTLPRLTGQGLVLSRLGGGIGTRGPGETKLEKDRRHIRNRIADIERNLAKVKSVRQLHLKNRATTNNSLVSLVGYTNAGKSTLLNTLTNAQVYAEDKLFATLDPTTRKLALPSGKEILLTDTVGFIRKLPHQLVAAFRATLEEVVQANLLLHVIDASNPFYQEQSDAVYKVLDELRIHDKKIITVFNKVDKISAENILSRMLRLDNSIAISAKNETGLQELLELIDENLSHFIIEEQFLVPYDKSDVVAKMHDAAKVLQTNYVETGTLITLLGAKELLEKFSQYKTGGV